MKIDEKEALALRDRYLGDELATTIFDGTVDAIRNDDKDKFFILATILETPEYNRKEHKFSVYDPEYKSYEDILLDTSKILDPEGRIKRIDDRWFPICEGITKDEARCRSMYSFYEEERYARLKQLAGSIKDKCRD